MARVGRRRMSTAEKAEVWRRWKRGESLSDIGRALGRIRDRSTMRAPSRKPESATAWGPDALLGS